MILTSKRVRAVLQDETGPFFDTVSFISILDAQTFYENCYQFSPTTRVVSYVEAEFTYNTEEPNGTA